MVAYTKKNIITIFTTYVIILSCYVIAGKMSPFPLSWGDTCTYLGLSVNLVNSMEFSFNNYHGAPPPPLYSIFITPVVYLSNIADQFSIWLALVNGSAYACLIFIGLLYGRATCLNLRDSIIAGILITITPTAFQYTQDVMSENIYIPLSTLALYLAVSKPSIRKYVLYAVVASSMLLTKPIGIVPITVLNCYILGNIIVSPNRKLFLHWGVLTCALPYVILTLWLSFAHHFVDFETTGYPKGYSNVFISTMTNWESFVIFIERIVNLIGYMLISTYFLPLTLLFSAPKSTQWDIPRSKLYSCVLLVFIAAASLAAIAQGVFFQKPSDGHYYIYGRYIEGTIPAIFFVSFAHIIEIVKSLLKQKYTLRYRIISGAITAVISIIVIICYPFQYHRGLNSVGLSTIVYINETLNKPILLAIICGSILFAVIAIPFKSKHFYMFSYLGLIGILLFGSVKEMQRVNKHKAKWKESITNSKLYAEAAPDKVTHIIIDPQITKSKSLWYLRPLYLKARYYYPEHLQTAPPPSSLYLSNGAPPPYAGFRLCDKLTWATAYCNIPP